MYQFRSATRSTLRRPLAGFAASLLGSAVLFAAASPAYAASSSLAPVRQELSQTRLAAMKGSEVTRIDWRQPEMKLKFDLTESDWIDGIDLILAMTPQGGTSRKDPVLVSLNNSAPLKMYPHGRSFDARLRFDESFVRAKGNVITIRVPAPEGAACLTPQHGHWDVNTAKSSIVVRTRAKSRNFYLREVAMRLQNPTTTPKTVSLLASGAEKTRLQMLAAQGIALQTPDIPDFKTTAGRSDMQVIIGRRDQLSPRVSDRKILSASGPKISVHKGRPMRLVITGDTDGQVLKAAKAFATHKLPAVRRAETSSGELTFQTAFADDNVVIDGKARFDDLNQSLFAMDWRTTPNMLTFNVADPSVTSGNVLLRMRAGHKIANDSRVEIELNGQSLGFTNIDRKRKSVNFDIPEGALQGSGNTLKITPVLEKNATVDTFGQSCPAMDDMPGFNIKGNSRIELSANGETPASELSRFTANGSLFAEDMGANTHIVLTAGSQNDIGASLELLAKLAKTSGTGWVNATVSRESSAAASKNLLVIGPNAGRTNLLGDAPRALTAALKGKPTTGEMVRNLGDYEKFASADAAKTMQIYAAKNKVKTRIGSGGVAAIYPDSERLIGVISSTPGRSFSSAAQDLTEDKQWNTLSGSVARWNSKTVLMAQTAIPSPGLKLPKMRPDVLPRFDLAWLEDGFSEVVVKTADLSDAANDKIASIWDDTQARFADGIPARIERSKTPEAAPVYVSTKIQKTASPRTLPTVAAQIRTISKAGLVAPLRGFSRPGLSSKADSRAPKWITDLLSKFQKKKSGAQGTAISAPAAAILKDTVNSVNTPITKFKALSDRNFGFFGILLSIAVLIMALLLSLVAPSRDKAPVEYKRK